jgi:ribosome-binding factor A
LQSFRPAIQKGIIQNSLRFKESTSLKFIPRVEFKRDIELEKKIRLEEIYRKLDADTIKPLDAL